MSISQRYVVLQEMEDEDPDVFRVLYSTVDEAMTAIREMWLDEDNVRDHNAHVVNEWEMGMEIALGDSDDPCLTCTVLPLEAI